MGIDADHNWMEHAIRLAHRAEAEGEVPVGAVLVLDNQIIGEGWNQPISRNDPTAHAEIVALRQAAQKMNNYRLPGSILYVTLEPCSMCAGALVHARVQRVVLGASDPKPTQFNHMLQYESGLMAAECSEILRKFFQARR